MTAWVMQCKTVDEAIDAAIQAAEVRINDDSFGYEYGSITGTHKQYSAELVQDTIEVACRVPVTAGWLWERSDDDAFRSVIDTDIGVKIPVEARLIDGRFRIEAGWWLLSATFALEEVDPDE